MDIRLNAVILFMVVLANCHLLTKMETSLVIPNQPNEISFQIDYKNNCFLKDGKAFRYISGTMHYFRVPQYYWEDRFKKMRAAGLNAVETYVAWQVHEPIKGKFNFIGENDIVKYIELAQKNDLLVILRPGPFIDAERDFGGLPPWLLKKKNITLRTSTDKDYIDAVASWFSVLLPMVSTYLYHNGGPIIMVQVENEYGSYFACDKDYLGFLRNLCIKYLGNEVVLFTVDGGFSIKEIECGGLSTLFKTVDFGPKDNVSKGFELLRKLQPSGPLVNTEYYTGWLDHWGEPHQTRSTELVTSQLDKILAQNASVNLYMFEGGTSFGFLNGAEIMKDGQYCPEPTSYDYDAPLSEAGDPTDKYYAIRKVIGKYELLPPIPVPPATPKAAYGKIALTEILSLFEALPFLVPDGSLTSKFPERMEDIGQNYGFILYRTTIADFSNLSNELLVEKVHDRAVVMVDKVYQGTLERNGNTSLKVSNGKQLDILVENQGRTNYQYGSFVSLNDPKGIIGNASINGKVLEEWKIFPLPLDNIKNVSACNAKSESSNKASMNIPSLYFGSFQIETASDTFLKTSVWTKGQAFINGFNLGRYWPVKGPQQTLYVPKSILKESPDENLIVLFEIDGLRSTAGGFVEFVDKPEWAVPH